MLVNINSIPSHLEVVVGRQIQLMKLKLYISFDQLKSVFHNHNLLAFSLTTFLFLKYNNKYPYVYVFSSHNNVHHLFTKVTKNLGKRYSFAGIFFLCHC